MISKLPLKNLKYILKFYLYMHTLTLSLTPFHLVSFSLIDLHVADLSITRLNPARSIRFKAACDGNLSETLLTKLSY